MDVRLQIGSKHICSRLKARGGQALAEYALILVSVATVAMVGYLAFGAAVVNLIGRLVSAI
jgi:Flp pilus assembly pilin Flp